MNVHCSSGFYLSVAKPAFSSISNEFKAVVSGISLKCEETRSEKDKHGNGVNWVFWFKIALNGPDGSLSSATVHIHNTQRLIQVQGGAAIWFVENVLRERFTNESKNKKVDIANINKTFNLLSKNLLQNGSKNHACPECHKKFQSNTKTLLCQSCNLFLHGSKQSPCLRSHKNKCFQQAPQPSFSLSSANASLSPPTTTPPSLSTVSEPFPMQHHTNVPPSLPRPVVQVPVVKTVITPSETYTTATSSGQSPVITLTRATTTTTTTVTASLPSNPTPAIAGPSHVSYSTTQAMQSYPCTAASSLTNLTSTIPAKKATKKMTSSIDIKDTEISVLKQELVIVKTKLLQTEADCKDLKRKNDILADSIKIYKDESSRNNVSSSSLLSPPLSSIPLVSESKSLIDTMNRLLNYFLDVVEKSKMTSPMKKPQYSSNVPTASTTSPSCTSPPKSSPCSTSALTLETNPGPSPDLHCFTSTRDTGTPYPNITQEVEATIENTEKVSIEDCSMETIDEFTPEILLPNDGHSDLENLNCQVLTIQ